MSTGRLARENGLVLTLVQAMLGAVSPNFRRVSLNAGGRRVRLRFVLERESPKDREEIEDIAFEFEALLGEPVDLEVEVIVDPGPLSGIPPAERLVYARRET